MNVEMHFDLTRTPKQNLGLPPNAIPGLTVIKNLVRNLRYRQISQLTGLEVEISSLRKANEELRTLIHQNGYSLKKNDQNHEGTFLKYGILDLEFEINDTNFEIEKRSVRFLKEMGILTDKAEVDDSFLPDAGIGFLEEMLEETKTNKLLFKIFLESSQYQGIKSTPLENIHAINPEKYFPCKFIVRDACITNCSYIWLTKHFYL